MRSFCLILPWIHDPIFDSFAGRLLWNDSHWKFANFVFMLDIFSIFGASRRAFIFLAKSKLSQIDRKFMNFFSVSHEFKRWSVCWFLLILRVRNCRSELFRTFNYVIALLYNLSAQNLIHFLHYFLSHLWNDHFDWFFAFEISSCNFLCFSNFEGIHVIFDLLNVLMSLFFAITAIWLNGRNSVYVNFFVFAGLS